MAVLLITSCVNTKITNYYGTPRLIENSGILILPTKGIAGYWSQQLYEQTKAQFKDTEARLFYLPEEEYNLIKAGISKDMLDHLTLSDTITLAEISEHLGVRYIIGAQVNNLQQGANYGVYTENDLNQYNSPYNTDNESNKADVLFDIYHVNSRSIEAKFLVHTSINPLIIQEDEGSESRVNVTDQMTALYDAYKKAFSMIKKGMVAAK
ncbi:hypothetical protein LVD15_04480 [Fulvivirga maritima]|uniref:hypothetical protein n=1 Tax=Fulvivirga maritima TaxID=2904247 RepID=UPI001F41E30D|nr:hypothetical protein [Fulvivirga maritima]UII27686.1 hypothetical protein LVD15_04480 [Fulvivirga maritima]